MRTAACDLLNITHPVVLAGMGSGTNPELVAAVSNAGGLGILACTWLTEAQANAAIDGIRSRTDRPFGVNFVAHDTDEAVLSLCLAKKVPVFSFFLGHPAAVTARAHAAGAKVVHQVTTLDQAAEAVAAGVDVLVAQGCEAGGHMGALPLWTFLPEVVALAGSRPVLAAGGLVDGKDLAAALCFGASGVLMGTRFLASIEAPIPEAQKQAMVKAGLDATVASVVWDHIWDAPWPGNIRVRSLRNVMTDRWAGHEAQMLPELDRLRAEFQAAQARGDFSMLPMLAGEGVARIRSILPAAQIVRDIVREADDLLRAGLTIR